MWLLMLTNELIKHYQIINRSLFNLNWNAYWNNELAVDSPFDLDCQLDLKPTTGCPVRDLVNRCSQQMSYIWE